ncbi:molybdopterin synthase sulfur carrier subunit [Onthophagus taurus]|uniref:molybdopterin synthase sulfur carrier subunit n=1 Tax=Onthophagus taurus TaxID=166361 RepID=UPI0039BE76DD
MNVTVRVYFFAKAKELANRKESFLTISNSLSYKDLFEALINQFNLVAIKDNIVLALNEQLIDENSVLELKTGDILAIIPPLSGG